MEHFNLWQMNSQAVIKINILALDGALQFTYEEFIFVLLLFFHFFVKDPPDFYGRTQHKKKLQSLIQ